MRLFVMVIAALFAVACVDRGPSEERQIDPEYVEANLVDAVPDDLDHRVEADLGGKVIYEGHRVVSESVERGSELRVVHYWRVVDPPGGSWRVFAHAVGASEQDWLNIDATDMRIGYPPGRWEAGDIIRDEQVFVVPEGWSSDYVDLRVGLYRRGGQSVGDRMSIASGPADDETRVEAGRIPFGARDTADDAAGEHDAGASAAGEAGDDAGDGERADVEATEPEAAEEPASEGDDTEREAVLDEDDS